MDGRRLRLLLGSLLCTALCLLNLAASAQTVRGDLSARFAHIPTLEHNGTTYTLNQRMTSLLIIGIDNAIGQAEGNMLYRSGAQADFLLLMAVNDDEKTVTPIQINRDTLAEIAVLSVLGVQTGTTRAQIALSHAYGNGGTRSCELTVQAVSNLLLDTAVDEYLSLSMDGIPTMNDLLGGVTVTLSEDFSAYDPAMTPGKTLRLEGVQAEYYVRQRYYVGDQSNLSRQVRQRDYLNAAKDILGEKIRSSKNFAGTLYDGLEPHLITSMSRGKLINLANKIASYEVLPIEEIGGTLHLDSDGFAALEPDEQHIHDLILRTYYHPKSF